MSPNVVTAIFSAALITGCLSAPSGLVPPPPLALVAAHPHAHSVVPVVAAHPHAHSVVPVVAAAVSEQHHAQDELGQYSYGYTNPLSAKEEVKTADGITRGGYSYLDSRGLVQSVNYVSDDVNGFRVAASNLPLGPVVPAQDEPVVAHAKAQAVAALAEAALKDAAEPQKPIVVAPLPVDAVADETNPSDAPADAAAPDAEAPEAEAPEAAAPEAAAPDAEAPEAAAPDAAEPDAEAPDAAAPEAAAPDAEAPEAAAPDAEAPDAASSPEAEVVAVTPAPVLSKTYPVYSYPAAPVGPVVAYSAGPVVAITPSPVHVPAAPVVAGVVTSQHHAQDELGQYSYGYSNPLSAKEEVKTFDGITRGGYSYLDSNGAVQNVNYVSDHVNGFRVAASNLPVQPVHASLPDSPDVASAKATFFAEIAKAEEAVEAANRADAHYAHAQPLPYAHAQPLIYAHPQPKPYAHAQPLPYAHAQPLPYGYPHYVH